MGLSREVLWRLHGCLAKKPSALRAMRRWNTRHACAPSAISARETYFPARTLVYSVRNSWRRGVSRAWNAALFRFLKGTFALAHKHSSA